MRLFMAYRRDAHHYYREDRKDMKGEGPLERAGSVLRYIYACSPGYAAANSGHQRNCCKNYGYYRRYFHYRMPYWGHRFMRSTCWTKLMNCRSRSDSGTSDVLSYLHPALPNRLIARGVRKQ